MNLHDYWQGASAEDRAIIDLKARDDYSVAVVHLVELVLAAGGIEATPMQRIHMAAKMEEFFDCLDDEATLPFTAIVDAIKLMK